MHVDKREDSGCSWRARESGCRGRPRLRVVFDSVMPAAVQARVVNHMHCARPVGPSTAVVGEGTIF